MTAGQRELQRGQSAESPCSLGEKARDLVFRHLCYLASSAAGLVTEPHMYGPFRLVDSAERLIGIMKELGWSDDFLDDLAGFIGANKESVMTDEAHFVRFLDELVVKLAGRLRGS